MQSDERAHQDGKTAGSSTAALPGVAPTADETAMSSVLSARPRVPPNRRRDKPQLSCNQCRLRKSRCDRQQPCHNCAARGQACVYGGQNRDLGVSSSPMSFQAANPNNPNPSLHDRLVHLERLCMSLIQGPPKAYTGSGEPSRSGSSAVSDVSGGHPLVSLNPPDGAQQPSSPDDISLPEPSECGSLHRNEAEQRYVGGDHWTAILDSIADLKDHFDREERNQLAGLTMHADAQGTSTETSGESQGSAEAIEPSRGALLLYGRCLPASRAEILGALPPKSFADRYISRYFNRQDLVSPTVHGPTFLKEYEEFWANPLRASLVWIGLLFSLLCLALTASEDTETEQKWPQIYLYREKTVQCLLLGEYTKGAPYSLEAFIHYVYIEFILHPDAYQDLWFLQALEVNLAMRMGYHRDPKHFGPMPASQAEIRRRVWALVVFGDILMASQMGLPRMIVSSKHDTAEPRNLNDSDLAPDCLALPPARPETECTTAIGVIARSRVMVALAAVSDLVSSVHMVRYADVRQADQMLRDASARIPPALRMRPMAASVVDTPVVIMSRLFVQHLVYTGQIMLYRRFLLMEGGGGGSDAAAAHPVAVSQRTCIDACLGMLQIQHILEEETRAGGQLYTMRWRVTSLMNHQFLTATLILCSLLLRQVQQRQGQGAGAATASSTAAGPLYREHDILSALRSSRIVWLARSSTSREAKTAAETTSLVLARSASAGSTNEVPVVSSWPGPVSVVPMHEAAGEERGAEEALPTMTESDGWQGYLADLPALPMANDYAGGGILAGMGGLNQSTDWQKFLQETMWNQEMPSQMPLSTSQTQSDTPSTANMGLGDNGAGPGEKP